MAGMSRRTLPEHARVVVVGAGFAGLAMAIKLAEAGETDEESQDESGER